MEIYSSITSFYFNTDLHKLKHSRSSFTTDTVENCALTFSLLLVLESVSIETCR